jgi:hypothetical protein
MPLTDAQVRIRSRVAAVGAIAAWTVVALLVLGNFFIELVEYNRAYRGLAMLAFGASVALWIVCWLEYFRERPAEYSLVWAFLLMTGPILGPLLFYHRIWRSRYANRAI